MIMEHGDGGMDHGGHMGHDMPMPMPSDGNQCSVCSPRLICCDSYAEQRSVDEYALEP